MEPIDRLMIDKETGVAFQLCDYTVEYDADYWNKYKSYENTEIAKKINAGRLGIVKKYCGDTEILDIGIGSGEFIKLRGIEKCFGYDVNKYAVEWLKEKNIYVDITDKTICSVSGITFWDSFEHIPDIWDLVRNIDERVYVFISIPIFDDITKHKNSKHYRPFEHLWYFTEQGLVLTMRDFGFKIVERTNFEITAGREGIYTFVFIRA